MTHLQQSAKLVPLCPLHFTSALYPREGEIFIINIEFCCSLLQTLDDFPLFLRFEDQIQTMDQNLNKFIWEIKKSNCIKHAFLRCLGISDI